MGPMLSLKRTSSEENRHMTAVAGVWSVTVGYSSSEAGTSRVGVIGPLGLDEEDLEFAHDSVVGETTNRGRDGEEREGCW
jgi:hypothetical protein